MPGAWDMAAGQPESAPGALPGGLMRGPLVPGMGVQSPALDYVVGRQRRRMRHIATVAASILAIVVVAAVVAIAAHGGGGTKAGSVQMTAAQVVQQATRQQSALRSESATFSEQVTGQASATITGTVEMQRKPLLMAMNINVTGYSGTTAMRALLTVNAMYIKLGNAAGVPSYLAGKWLKIPLTGLGQSSVFASLLHEVQNENPTSQFAGLDAASHLRANGTQVVGGVTTTKYTGSFAPSAAVKALPTAQRATLAPYLNLIKGDVAFTVWIDSRHFVRKFQETERVDGTTISIDGTYSSFNQPVKIALPPSSQVFAPPASALTA